MFSLRLRSGEKMLSSFYHLNDWMQRPDKSFLFFFSFLLEADKVFTLFTVKSLQPVIRGRQVLSLMVQRNNRYLYFFNAQLMTRAGQTRLPFFIRPGFIKHSYPGKFVHLQQQTAVFTLDLLLFPLMLSSNSWRKPSEGWAGAVVAQEAEQVVQFTPPQWEFSNLARLGKNVSEDLDLVFGLGPVCCSLIIKVAVQFCTCVIWESSKKWIIINKYIIQFEKLKQKTPKQL